MVKKILLSLIAFVGGGILLSSAQNKQVTGTVADAEGKPVAGATVMVDGTSTGTTSAANGRFSISAPANGTLTISFIGYQTQKVAVANRSNISVTLAEDTTSIDEVTVVAFGTKRKQDLVGSVSKVKSTIIGNSQATSVSNALEGAVAGLQIVSASGQPGKDADIVIRGVGSLSASNKALVVVDGVPFNGNLSDINPADIESITVSKDAVSNSLYGSRAANGVVMVTTKSGRKDKMTVQFQGSWGVTTRAYKDYDMATDQGEFYRLTWYGLRNTAWAGGASLAEAAQAASDGLLGELGNYNAFIIPDGEYLVGTDGKLNANARTRYDDSFADALFQNSFRQEYNASASGGNDKTDYYVSMGYLDNESYVLGSSYDRLTTRVNVNSQLKRWLKVGANVAYSKTTQNGVMELTGMASNPFDVARGWAPIYPVHAYDAEGNLKHNEDGTPMYDAGNGETDGTKKRPTATNQNLINSLNEDTRKSVYHNLSSRTYVEVKFLKDFTFQANYSYDFTNLYNSQYYTPTIGDGASFGGRGTKRTFNTSTTNFNQLLGYEKSIGEHNVSAKLGHEYYAYRTDHFEGQKTRFFDPDNGELDNGGKLEYIESNSVEHNIEGYFAMADYNYAHKYYVSGAFRRDGTSRFKNRWGNFWSVGAAWRISAEDFMSGASSWLNDLKLRASYGTQGNENVIYESEEGYVYPYSYKLYQDQYAITWDGSSLGYTPKFYGNPDLTWEKQKTFDVGLDFRLWNHFYGSVEYFTRKTDDMLFQKTLNVSGGRPYNWENLGAMRNQGIEFELNVDIFKKKDFQWTVSLVGSHYSNKILTLPEENRAEGIVSKRYFKLMEGKSRYEYYTFMYAGMDEKGNAMWYTDELDDAGEPTGNKTTTSTYADAKKYYLGKSALPDFNGGLSTTLNYKGIDLSIATAFQFGGWAFDYSYLSGMSGSFYVGHNRDMWDTFNPETGTGKYPIWNADNSSNSYTQTSDAHLIKATYFSIRNITIGYSFPKEWMNKLGIGNIRIFLTGDNLALWSKRQGFDPRVSMYGGNTDYGGYSPMRVISGGVNLTF